MNPQQCIDSANYKDSWCNFGGSQILASYRKWFRKNNRQFQGKENHVKQIIHLACNTRNNETKKRVIHIKFLAESSLSSLITEAVLKVGPSPLKLAVLSMKWQLVFNLADTLSCNKQYPQEMDINDPDGIRTRNPRNGKVANSRLRVREHRNRPCRPITRQNTKSI